MSRRRTFLVILFSVVVIALAGLVFLAIPLDPDTIRDRLESRVLASLGMKVRIEGAVERHFLPPGASFIDIAVLDGKKEVLTAKRVKAEIALLPLLQKEIRLSNLALYEPMLSFRRDESGALPFRIPGGAKAPFVIGGVSVREGTVRFSDAGGRTEMKLDGLDLELEEVREDGAGSFSFSGGLRAGRLGIGRVEVLNLRGSLNGNGNLYRIEPLRGELFGSEARGKFEVDLGGTRPAWRGELIAGKLSLTELSRSFAGRPLLEGVVETRAVLSGEVSGRIVDTMDGTVRMSGADIVQHGFDIDRLIGKFRATRDIDLLDIAVYVLAVPLNVLAGKGVNLGGKFREVDREERQVIEKLVFQWSLNDGVARAEDVAFRTRENRLAFQGAVDLKRGRYDDLTLGLLNTEGCAELTEEISGPLTDPSVEKGRIVGTLAATLVGVLRKGWEIVDFRDCRPFYAGVVAHPGEGRKDQPGSRKLQRESPHLAGQRSASAISVGR